MAARIVRPHHYVAYGLNDVLGAGSMAVISGWILFFYTTFCGLTAIEAAGIFAIARLLDAIWSPLVGHISDNLSSTAIGRRFGRRRFFLLLAIPLLPSFALMWVSGQTYLYYLCTYVFFELVYATVLIPYETLAAEMTDDYGKKAKFAGARILVGQTSAILAGFLPSWIVNFLGGEGSASTFFYMGAIFAALFVLVVIIVYLFTWERPAAATASRSASKTTLLGTFTKLYADLGSTLRIRAFRLHLGLYLGGYISQDVFNAAFTYFIAFALGVGLSGGMALASTMMGTMYVAQLASVACFIPLILMLHPGPSFRVAASLYGVAIAAFVALYWLRPAHIELWLFAPVILAGLGRGGLNYIPWNTYNYMADVDEIVTGKRREGIFAGVMTFIRKATQAGAVMLVGLILDAGGFMQGAQAQSASAIDTIVLLLSVGPLLLLGAGMLLSYKFKLSKRTHETLMSEIARFKSGAMEPANAESRRVVEDLTGWSYDKLWGRNPVGYRERVAPAPIG